MIIEIRKAGFLNKGAELMLLAALDRLRAAYPEARFAMAPTSDSGAAAYAKRAAVGLYQKAALRLGGIEWGGLARLAPRKLREMYGVVLDRELAAVLDASGFSYGDQWGHASTRELAQSCRRWRRNRTKVVLLPQAFGPFRSERNKAAIRDAVACIDRVYARDSESYAYLVEAVGQLPTLRMAPDFTCLILGRVPQEFETFPGRFAIIPNHRMIEMTARDRADAYLPFLATCARHLLARGARPFLLVHEERADRALAARVIEAVENDLPLLIEADPLRIKGILGACTAVLGSRFHGLVSALSQGVPCLAIGWSHKYRMLFEEYGVPEGLLELDAPEKETFGKIDLLLDQGAHATISERLLRAARSIKERSEQMWREVLDLLVGAG